AALHAVGRHLVALERVGHPKGGPRLPCGRAARLLGQGPEGRLRIAREYAGRMGDAGPAVHVGEAVTSAPGPRTRSYRYRGADLLHGRVSAVGDAGAPVSFLAAPHASLRRHCAAQPSPLLATKKATSLPLVHATMPAT